MSATTMQWQQAMIVSRRKIMKMARTDSTVTAHYSAAVAAISHQLLQPSGRDV